MTVSDDIILLMGTCSLLQRKIGGVDYQARKKETFNTFDIVKRHLSIFFLLAWQQ